MGNKQLSYSNRLSNYAIVVYTLHTRSEMPGTEMRLSSVTTFKTPNIRRI